MTDIVPGPDQERWWADLEPQTAVSRPALVKAFAQRSLSRFKQTAPKGARIDVEALTKQINGFSVELAKRAWARPAFTRDGIRCMQARVKDTLGEPDDLHGWSRVLDVYGNICNPLAHYVISYYPPLYDLRPSGLPRDVMSTLKDRARYNACNALRDALVSDFGGERPLLDDEERLTNFLAAVSSGSVTEAERHERDITLAYAAELSAYARRIAADPWVVLNNEAALAEQDVASFAEAISTRADELRARYAGQIPSIEESRAQVQKLMRSVDAYITETSKQITTITAAAADAGTSAGRKLAELNAESEHFAAAYESTRTELVVLVSRGHQKTEQDALLMFIGRVRPAVKRDNAAKRGRAGKPVDGTTPEAPPPPTANLALYHRLRETLVAHRDEIPSGFGRHRDGADSAEYTVTLELLDSGASGLEEITEFCFEHWESYRANAVASDPEELAEHVIAIMRWAAIRSGLR